MNSKLDLVASFSQDVRQFAFQTNVSQKNVIDIYPLDASNSYSVNSSLVSHIDYEGFDLKVSDISFLGWCSSPEEATKQRTKRKNGSDEINGSHERENFFVNLVSPSKIVIFSSTGKHIVNIIQNKNDILHVSLEDEYIWILDTETIVRKVQYNQTKHLKSFHLIDGKDEKINNFQVLKGPNSLFLSYASKDTLYIVDPSKRRPTTIAKLDVVDSISCELIENDRVAVATKDKILVFSLKSQAMVQCWDVKVERLRVVNDVILGFNRDDEIAAFKVGIDNCICRIVAVNSQIVEAVPTPNAIMVAWLNVNEPNFKLISLGDLNGNDEIVINDQKEEVVGKVEQPTNGKANLEVEGKHKKEEEESVKIVHKKVTRAEQDELTRSLVQALEPFDNAQVLNVLTSDKWNEHRVESFIVSHLITQEAICKLHEVVVLQLQKNPWEKNELLGIWLKWLLTLKGSIYLNSTQSKHVKKDIKRLKSSLRSSGDTLAILLGIQGRLEMLKSQAQLRDDLARLNVAENEDETEVETVMHDNVEKSAIEKEEYNDSISYANGESDTFVDASEFRTQV